MIGAIIGDIVGSRFEFTSYKSKEFEFFSPDCFITDDTVHTLAIARALYESDPFNSASLEGFAIGSLIELSNYYSQMSYGTRFLEWLRNATNNTNQKPMPYGSYGNGAAMRVSPVSAVAKSSVECSLLAIRVTSVTHNHPEGIKGAESVAMACYLARNGASKDSIHSRMIDYYSFAFTLDEIRDDYQFNETCQGTVPQALKCFLEADSFEDAIRNAISLGGDADTLAAITGSIAAYFFGVPKKYYDTALTYLDPYLLSIYNEFCSRYPASIPRLLGS